MDALLDLFARTALSPAASFLGNGNVRYFWPYIVAGMALAYMAHRASGDRRDFRSVMFERKVWTSRSAINDYSVFLLNPLIFTLFFSAILMEVDKIGVAVLSWMRAAGVSSGPADAGSVVAAAGLTLTLFVVNDALRWFTHYLQHKIPALWEFHKVHHSAEHLNFLTAERFHPVDAMVSTIVIALGVGVVNSVYIAFLGDQLTVFSVGGANVLWAASNMIGGALRHSPIWFSFGPRLERWLISPAMHHIHHSDDPRHFDKNMGGSLAIWDRMAGTHYVPDGREVTGFGLGDETPEYRRLSAIYTLPFRKAIALLPGVSAPVRET